MNGEDRVSTGAWVASRDQPCRDRVDGPTRLATMPWLAGLAGTSGVNVTRRSGSAHSVWVVGFVLD